MKRIFLLSSVALMASAMNAQQTYNWFDPADCDADGWLWFDSQAKIDKYCGYGKDAKIRLVDATYENENFEYPETKGDPAAIGWNEANEKGGTGAKTGAIILPESDFTQTSLYDVNGGGILLQFPDLAKFDLFLSVEGYKGWADSEKTIPGTRSDLHCTLYGGDGTLEAKDCNTCVLFYGYKEAWGEPLSEKPQYEWTDIQSVQQYDWGVEDFISLGSGADKAKTAYIWNNNKYPLYVHGIRVYTFAEATGVNDIAVENVTVKVEGKTIVADSNATVSVYTATGALVAKGQGNVDGGALTPGLYIVKATSANATTLKKIIL